MSGKVCINIFKRYTQNVSQKTFNQHFKTTPWPQLFWEPDLKGGYNKDIKKPPKFKLIYDGFKELKTEFGIWKEEIVEAIASDPLLVFQPGIVDKQWEIHKPEDLEHWVATSDSDHGQGYSTCSLTINQQGNGLFSGELSTQIPKDGAIKRSGYCTIRTKRARKSFRRDAYHDWCQYSHLVMRIRGDGRSYMLNISTSGYFDQLWNDVYHFILYTRGGPHWQVAKIPFSKFFFSNKGRIQDTQRRIPLDKISHFGITAADKINGPFSLEIDYIGLEFDPSHNEEFAYEMYRIPKNIAAT